MVGVRGVFSGVGICCCQSRQASLEVLPSFRCSIWRVRCQLELVSWYLQPQAWVRNLLEFSHLRRRLVMFSQSLWNISARSSDYPVSEKCPLLSWLESVFPLRPPSVLRVSEHSNAPTRDRRFARREVDPTLWVNFFQIFRKTNFILKGSPTTEWYTH